MQVREIKQILESWAPPSIAWEGDNVGLQIGSPKQRVRKILVALDITDQVIEEASRKKADLVISHHPLFFHPPRSLRSDRQPGRLSEKIIAARLSVFSLHTNLDYTNDGVSIALGEQLGLQDVQPLEPLSGQYQKLIVFVPMEYTDRVMLAMSGKGAGAIGKYDRCSYSTEGIGTFQPLVGSQPFIGTTGTLEHVREHRLEMIVPRWKTPDVLQAMRQAHPYEEMAYDIVDLANPSLEFGAGAIGTLKKKMNLKSFLRYVRVRLGAGSLRFSGVLNRNIQTVAVCGGSGSEYLERAVQRNADAFVTADIRYHTFQECDDRLALIDAGHYETEAPVIKKIILRLRTDPAIRKNSIQIFPSTIKTNYIHYF